METIKIDREKVKMIAHRGLSGLERENTMAAFIAAGNRSYYGIECDIHKTKDDQFVVIHDDHTARVSPINIKIKESSYRELQEIELYEMGTIQSAAHLKIPLLSQYLDVCKKYNKVCFLEFKFRFADEDIIKVLDIIEQKQYTENVVFISFILENLITVRKVNKNARIQFLTTTLDAKLMLILRKYRFGVDMTIDDLTEEMVDELHKYHIEVNVWTIDNPIQALMLVSWRVDYITTNILE